MLEKSYKENLEKIFKSNKPLDADGFFNALNFSGLGRKKDSISGRIALAYESLENYERILNDIYIWNREIYQFIHKGTPFYFCGIHAFDIGDYERAIFYFDSALSEDLKNKPSEDNFHWDNSAAKAFYALNTNYGNPIVKEPVNKIIETLTPLINEFSTILNIKFTLEDFVNKFANKKIENNNFISVIPTFYLFAYKSERRLLQLKLRSDKGGTIEPFILHLFSGALIFETLLKLTYPSAPKDLGSLLCDPKVKKELNYSQQGNLIGDTKDKRETLEEIIEKLIPNLETDYNIIDNWITLTYSIRNITAHNLAWPDKFDFENYTKLFKAIVFSILYIIYKKY